MKIAFVGTYDLIFPFKSLGAEIISIEDKDILEIKKEIEKSDYAIVFILEDIYKQLEDRTDITTRPDINIVPIPGIKGSQGYGKKRIAELIKKAVGMEIGGYE
ncbi:hypothetical protein KAW18_13260 [candidate division WOR-3 bacterium]|nr:hypothetical protein [candidate division WOR-3 bacterium]MCK4528335.1 hypothetical protein [candidate division WOR-3 bacterium]